MVINDTILNVELYDLLLMLKAELDEKGIPLLNTIKDTNSDDIMVSCPYHKDGQERKPSAGIRKSDGMFHCFRGDTKVITKEYGAVEIQSLVNSDIHILNGRGEWEQVRFNNYGKQSLMKITLVCNQKQKVIYATPEHEWLIKNYNKKYQTQELKPNMYLEKCIPKQRCMVDLHPMGIVHGFCYGDGTILNYNKSTKLYHNRCYFYNDTDLELMQYFNKTPFTAFNRGIAGNGKEYPYVIFKSKRNLKEVPELNESDSYLLGFLAGYFVADGNCHNNKITIYSHKYDDLYKIQQICTRLGIMSTEIGVSNIYKGQRGCVNVKEDTKGYTLRLARNTIPNNFFISKKGKGSKQLYTGKNRYKVVKVEKTSLVEDVYCCVTSTHSFTLEHFILTGNCFACGESHPLPDVISHCLGYNDPFGKYGFKWILDKFNTFEISNRNVQLNITRGIKKDEKHIDYVSDGELDSYRYMHPYWKKRNITDDNIIELFDLGYDKETDCITMPVRDEYGNCLFVARRSVKTKYFNYPKGVEKPLYGLYEYFKIINNAINIDIMRGRGSCKSALLGVTNTVFVTESMIDCILLWQSGYCAVALNGLGTDYQMKQLQELPCRKLILATDNDMAGRSARDNIKEKVTNKIITEIDFPDYTKDVGEMTREQIDHIKDLEIL